MVQARSYIPCVAGSYPHKMVTGMRCSAPVPRLLVTCPTDVRINPPGDPAARNVAASRGQRFHQDDWVTFGAQGGIGYDPEETGIGTPGYANFRPDHVMDDRRNSDADDDRDFDGTVTISEIMYDAGTRDNLAQWIELYNSSMTNGIRLNGWELDIRNKNSHAGDDQYINHVLELNDVTIPPNRTLLLVSRPVNNRSRTLDEDDPGCMISMNTIELS